MIADHDPPGWLVLWSGTRTTERAGSTAPGGDRTSSPDLMELDRGVTHEQPFSAAPTVKL
ncbi:MAG: hypothetical protein JNL83_07865 [Myxococcales bacterium]|nr:hypothetical protein [Myxococcales bacterium]